MQLLEDQLHLSAARIEAIKNLAAKFKINIHFLEPCAFEGIASEALAWKKFLNTQVGPPREGLFTCVICNDFVNI